VKVLIAGGGTGGHLFPGIALAEEVITRHPQNDVVFVGTLRGLEARVVPANGFKFRSIPSRGLKGMGLLKRLLGLLVLPLSFFAALRILLQEKPDVVVGVGGYSSGPVVLTAWLLRIPTALQEQNALAGFANRNLGRFVKAAFLSFEDTHGVFPVDRVHVLGNPIRRKLMDNYLRSKIEHAHFAVLIFGGSLGAHGVNTRMVEALPHLAEVKQGLTFLHQTGKADLAMVKDAYAKGGFAADVVEFIDDMSQAYGKSDLVICRAGATTLAELTCCKKASLLIPFPFATDDHQAVNAQAMVASGAALMFREAELTGEKLATELKALRREPERLRKMEKAAGLLGHPEAAQEIAEVLVELTTARWGSNRGQPRAGQEKKS
jgi:UDP-N-acetylglucosamine--N-acetylmuramyl-(pentapeptide) pyrophosphoryl-undecaprenol N-acetylglucosamine transferase